jgi:flavin-dependent dehydrogenase
MLERDGRSFNVLAKVLVGADGAASRVAKDLGLDQNREWIVGYEEVFFAKPATAEPRLHCFLDTELAPGYLAWLADDGEEIHVGVGGYAKDFDPQTALKKFKTKIAGLVAERCSGEPVERRGGRIPVGGVLRRIANTHGILVGDAAGAVSPLTAGGLDPCLRLSAMAASLISERLATGRPKVLLELSGSKFRARFVSRIWMRRIIAALQYRPLLEAGFVFLKGSLGKRLAAHVFFGRGSFPDIGEPHAREKKLAVL